MIDGDAPVLLLSAVALLAGGGGLLPFAPVEPLLVAIALTASPSVSASAVLVATVSQAGAKALLFIGSRGAESRLSPAARSTIDRVRRRLANRHAAQLATVAVSAAVGMPPLYLVTIATGALGLSLRAYLIASTAGRGARFAVLAMAPRLFM